MGGIAGSQSLALVIRAQALDQIGSSNSKLLILKESAIGLLNGIIWSGVESSICFRSSLVIMIIFDPFLF